MTVIEPVTKPSKNDVYAIVTDKILDALASGTVPWRKPWDPRVGMPLSMATNKLYRGVNIWLLGFASQLASTPYQSPYWGTYKKITELGGQVRKGEKSTMVTFWKTGAREQVVDGVVETKRWAMLRFYNVFNASQADGLPEKFDKAPNAHDHDPILEAQAILDGYVNTERGPKLTHAPGQGAYYAPFLDEIVLPPLAAFGVVEEFYATAFHESTHSTGHKSRLAREGAKGRRFGDEEYSKEELIAEMGSAMLCGIAGLEVTLDNSAAYVQSWIDVLRGDPRLVVSAAGAAQRAADLILGTEFADDQADTGEGVL